MVITSSIKNRHVDLSCDEILKYLDIWKFFDRSCETCEVFSVTCEVGSNNIRTACLDLDRLSGPGIAGFGEGWLARL